MKHLEKSDLKGHIGRGMSRTEVIVPTINQVDAAAAGAGPDSFACLAGGGGRSTAMFHAWQRAPAQKAVVDALFYWHPAPYWWPNPDTADGLPFVNRDGERVPGTRLYEPESDKYDRTRLQHVFEDSFMLALAWTFSVDCRFIAHAAAILERFLVDPQTRMAPHLAYA